MDLPLVLGIAFLGFLLFWFLGYVGLRITCWSSFILGLLVGLLLLNLLYPPGRLMSATAEIAIYLYVFIQLLAPLLLIIYILIAVFTDYRDRCDRWSPIRAPVEQEM